ncbi:mavicyanin-like [Solanum stenotomum]|uniref:mavicyanin-like n=1 Tax=Solanum stenotomum TaxID=172797 RepID=UPI0020D149E6|nr:mavicyanin-like [Solanum stenotomum]
MGFFRKPILLVMLVVMMSTLGSTTAAVYEVGDSSGWTFNYNYEQWAASKHFQLGDVLIFNYDPHFHNVRQVDKKNYNDCTDHNPLASFNTGSDTLTLETPGLYYFMCDIPGHCASGLRFQIKIDMPRVLPPDPETPPPPSPDPNKSFPNIPGYPAKNPATSSNAGSLFKCTWSCKDMLLTLFFVSSMSLSMV